MSTADALPAPRSRWRNAADQRFGWAIDLGHEPPLDTDGDAVEIDQREVNLRWLGASVLTALTGAVLIGGAIFVALRGETTFAIAPERVTAAQPRQHGGPVAAARKGDKLVRTELVASARQQFRAPTTIKVGEREVIRPRSFVRVATNLTLTGGVYASEIPPFNPARLLAQDPRQDPRELQRLAEAAPDIAASEAEASVLRSDLTDLAIPKDAPALTDEEVAALVEEERRSAAEAARRPGPALAALPRTLSLLQTLPQPASFGGMSFAQAVESSFDSIEVRVVPENVTKLDKAGEGAPEQPTEERDLSIGRGETLETVLGAQGATPEDLRAIVAALGGAQKVAALPENQRMRVLLARDSRRPQRVILYGERGIEMIAAASDRGGFVAIAPPVESGPQGQRVLAQAASEEEEEADEGGLRLYESFYETALKNELPPRTIEEMLRIFTYDVDFQRRVAPGDSFEVFYATDEEGTERPELLSVALTVGGETRRVYRYQGEDGSVDYFDPDGRSLKKFLVRKPMEGGVFRSGFGYRRHPILGYSKMHTGVDWAARIGTPIIAAGNGTVIKAEWDSGYGRRVEIQHPNGYVSAYSHQSRFASGISPGARVRQGQIIGYVGNTGLSTGPHLHYEVLINGRFVDPLRIRVPRSRELEGRMLAEFKRQKEQTDALLQKAGGSARLAQNASLR